MANKKQIKSSQINKVKHRTNQEDTILSSTSKLQEDDKKTIRKKGKQLDIKKGKKSISQEENYVKKPKSKIKTEQTKEKKDRHAPRKSDIEKEYTKELQKLRNRLRYREKQGFFVRWETLPSRALHPTQIDIEKLKQYSVQLNDMNEIYLQRDEYNKQARIETLALPSGLLPTNLLLNNEVGFRTPKDNDGYFDVIEHIREVLFNAYMRASYGVDYDDFYATINLEAYTALEISKAEALAHATNVFETSVSKNPTNLVEIYLQKHEPQIADLCEKILRASRIEQVEQFHDELIRYLEFH